MRAVDTPVFRFAPSPNGFLHRGHAYSALLNAALAGEHRGRLLLRIEDIDVSRSRPDFETALYEDLRWLGLRWDEPVLRQSEHFRVYADALRNLRDGNLVYPCFCSRGEIASAAAMGSAARRDPDGAPLYPGTCRDLAPAERAARAAQRRQPAWRLDMARALAQAPGALTWQEFDAAGHEHTIAADPALWGDAVIGRRDVPTSYHLSVVLDDARQGVTHVVRGRDLYEATGLHHLLQALLGLTAPLYRHHGLIVDGEGRKLAKSRGSPSLRALRAEGVDPADIRNSLGFA